MKLESINKGNYGKLFNKCDTFANIYDVIENADMNNKQKGDLFEVFSYFLIKLSPQLNANMVNIWFYDDVPAKLLKELNLPSKDKGIDLLIETSDGYNAIQCKFRQNENTVINWNEVATFYGLSFGVANKIKGGMFITNTVNMCDEVVKSTKVRVIDGNFFNEFLPENFFTNVCLLINKRKALEYTKKEPLPHQKKFVNACLNYFDKCNVDFDEEAESDTESEYFNESDCDSINSDGSNESEEYNDDHRRAQCAIACAGGKTLGSYWIDQKMDNDLTLFSVPSLSLLSQAYSDFVNQSFAEKSDVKFLLIGSDVDTDDNVKFKGGALELHTDPIEIRKHICKALVSQQKLIIICTYQSADKLIEACSKHKIYIDFGIFDEAHKTVGQAGKKFSLLLDDANLVIRKRLFMTATPKMYQGRLNEDDDKDVLSMDNEKIYGKSIFSYKTDEAIKDKTLVDYDVISIVATDAEVEELIKKNNLVSFKKEFADEESNYLATILVLLKKLHDGTSKHLLTYHNTVARSKKFCEFLIKINDLLYKDKKISVDSFDGTTSMSKRGKAVKDFVKSTSGVLCTARVLNEGVNIPIIDSVCFVDERNSTVDIVQCVGRMLRKCQGKIMAHVFIPTFIKSLDDEDVDGKAFGNTIRILKAMKTTDEDIIDYFTFKQEGDKIVERQIIKFVGIDTMTKSQEIEMDKWSGVIEGKIWKVIDTFSYKKILLFEYVEINKRTPSGTHKYNGVNLGIWFADQKTKIKSKNSKIYKSLNANKIIKDNIDLYLTNKEKNKNKVNHTFDEKLKILFDVAKDINRAPTQREKYSGVNLGTWFTDQKKKIKSKNDEIYRSLSTNKIIKDDVDLYLTNKGKNKNKTDYTFDEKLKILFDVVKDINRTPTQKEKYKNVNIGQWLQNQKNKIKSKDDKLYKMLSANKIIKDYLDDLFKNRETKSNRTDYTLDEIIEIIFDFVNENENAPTAKEIYKNINIGKWLTNVKRKIKSKDDKLYKMLSVNKIIKIKLDTFLTKKGIN